MTDNRKKAKFRDCENHCGRKTNAKDGMCHYCIIECYDGDRHNFYLERHCAACGEELREFPVDYGSFIDHWHGCPEHDFPWNDEQVKRFWNR